MKKKMKSKLLAILMSLAMAFTMMPIMGATVYADDSAPAAPGIATGTDVLSIGSNTSGAATVHMAGTKWRVIGYKGGGVASTEKDPEKPGSADTMTLIAADNLMTGVKFNPSDNQVNIYKDSVLYNTVNYLTHETNGIFSAGEKAGIVPRTLETGSYISYSPYTDGIAGDEVEDALLWPLSTKETFYMYHGFWKASAGWWLRSPGYHDNYAACVGSNGYIDDNGDYVGTATYAVRPAFNFNLESVIFTSAAAGGKSDTVGTLSKVGTNDSSEWKLTLKDEAHESFRVNDMMQTAGTKKFTIQYGEAAADGKTEYISTVIKSKDNRIKYYGKITKAVAGDKSECEIDIGGIAMEGGDTLYVFNEQCNGTNKTDYASELTEVYTEPIPPTITTQPNDLELTYGDTTGDTIEVAAEAEDGYTLSYQWYYKEAEDAEAVILDNETNASCTVSPDKNVGKTLYYYCEVTATRTGDGAKATTISNLASVTINKAELTVKPKNQMFTYNGQLQGPGDAAYVDPADIARYVDVEGLKFKDTLTSVTIDGQGKEVGITPLDITGIMIKADEGKGDAVTDNYDIQNEEGVLEIHKAEITITADYKNCKDLDNADPFTWTMEDEANKWYEAEKADITLDITDVAGSMIDPKTAPAGIYKIVPSWKNENKNYEATFVNGTFEKHKLMPHDKVPPTCTTPGIEAYWSCGLCSKMFSDKDGNNAITEPLKISATGHKYGAWTKLNATQHQKVCEHDKSHVVKENHKWDGGKVTKKATEKQAGVKTYTCTVCKATKTETIPKLKPSIPKTSGTPLAKATVKNKSMTIGWNKIQGAAGYDIFFATCNHSGKKIACKNVKTIKGNKTFKWTKSGLKKGTAYKFYVRAYVMKNGKKTYVSKSPMFHAYTGNGTKNYTNAKSVTVNKTKVTLKKGKTFKIKAKVNKVNKKKKLMSKSHAPTLRYMTSNSKIATVNSSGKITAKGKGTCYIYTFAHNGVSKQIKVTVK